MQLTAGFNGAISYTPVMSYGLSAVLKEVGIPAVTKLPTVVGCPICKGSVLEVHSKDLIFCPDCLFVGDAIELYATYKKQSVEISVTELATEGIISVTQDYLRSYRDSYSTKTLTKAIHTEAMSMFKEQPSSLRAVQQFLGAQLEEIEVLRLLPHVGLIRRDSILEAIPNPSKPLKAALKQLGGYTGLGWACWDNSTVIGYWVVTPKGLTYLPLINRPGIAGLLAVRLGSSAVFVLDNPAAALRIWLRAVKTGKHAPAMVSWGDQICMTPLPATQTIYWSPENTASWYYTATKTLGAKTIVSSDTELVPHLSPPTQPIQLVTQELEGVAKPALHALGVMLLELPIHESKAIIANNPLDERSRATCLSYFSGADADTLQTLLVGGSHNKHIEWNGKHIAETEQGWFYNKTLICDAILRIEQIKVGQVTAEATVTGSIMYKKRSFVFIEKLDVLRKNCANWLHGFILTRTGCSCCIAPGWQRNILNIAQSFHAPEGIVDAGAYSWDNDTLRLPYFSVSPAGLIANYNRVSGPPVQMPSPLSETGAWAAHDIQVCKLFLAVVHNLVATRYNKPCRPIAIAEQPHRINELVNVLGLDCTTNLQTILAAPDQPLPVIINDRPSGIEHVTKNIVVSLDSKSYRFLQAYTNWVRIGVLSRDLQILGLVFAVLPKLLNTVTDPTSPMFHRSIVEAVQSELLAFGVKTDKFMLAGSSLDADRNQTGLANIGIDIIQYGVSQDAIKVSPVSGGYSIKPSEYATYLLGSTVKLPPLGDIELAMATAKFVFRTGKDEWTIPEHIWGLFSSLCAPGVPL